MVDEKTYFLDTKTAMNEVMGRLTGKKWFEGIKTGFFDIDKRTGGFENKKLIILGSRPAMGKTALALNMLKNIAVTNKVPSVCFSLAVPKNEILRRLLYLKAGRAIYPDSAITEKQAAAVFTPIAEEIGNSPVLILDDYVRIDDIVGKCMELKEKSGIGFVVIDYLQLVRDSEEFSGYAEALNEIARKLKKLAVDMDCPVLALSQLNRNVEYRPDHRPMLSDLYLCGGLEHLADEILFLYRDDYYYQTDTEQTGTAELIVAKHNMARTGRILMGWDSESYRFYNDRGDWDDVYGTEEEEVLDLDAFTETIQKNIYI